MHLKSFKVTKINGEIVREVLFHNGLNLIVGFPEDKLSTTNGLGKTTLLRCIDFCLAGEIKQLYEDPESKNKNEKVYQFLLANNPSFTLIVEDESKSIISIERNIDLSKNRNKIINKINQKKYSNDEFKKKLSLLFFDNKSEKPSLRQLIPKFIRKDENQISNILKYLHPSTTNTSYEAIHSFLFGFNESELLKEKISLTEKIKGLKNKKDFLSEKNKEHELEQLLPLLKKEIEELQEKRNTFQINEAYEKDENELKGIQQSLIKINHKIEQDEIKYINAKERLNLLNTQRIDKRNYELEYLYNEVSHYIEKVDKKFEELVEFHNSMLENEKNYLIKLIGETEDKLSKNHQEKNNLISRYNKTLAILGETGSLQEYTKLSNKIDSLLLEYGDKNAIYDIIKNINKQIKEAQIKLQEIQSKIDKGDTSLKENITIFNKYFSNISNILYGKKYFLSYSDGEVKEFQIKDFSGNPGSGEKQAINIAFDLAYIQFSNDLGLTRPLFVLHDKVELIDIDKYEKLFDLANSLNGQLIFPVIFDKIEKIYSHVKEYIVLELSSKNRFFNI